MTAIVIAMLVIVVIAAVVVLYVAYPHRGEELPVAPKLGEAMSKAVEALPTVEPGEEAPAPPVADRPGPPAGRHAAERPAPRS